MPNDREKKDIGVWGKTRVAPGEGREVRLAVSESYAGYDMKIPVYVWRGEEPGPAMFVTAAVHGDEINGTGAIRHIIVEDRFQIRRGALLLVPVVNLLGFERHSRYMPDRRDLNRSFPGSETGSLTSRFAFTIFDEIVRRCDCGIDLHTGAVRRTNFPNVRADLSKPGVAELARAFGSELIVNGVGPRGSLRRAACRAGCPTIILEAGEVWKVEPSYVEYAIRGIRNCLIHLGMIDGEPVRPAYHIETDATKWVRATVGGFLDFHVAPGDIVQEGDAIATSTSLTGRDKSVIPAPREGIVLGMTTLPSVAPGDPICHLAFAKERALRRAERVVKSMDDDTLHERMRGDLARSVHVQDAPEETEPMGESGAG